MCAGEEGQLGQLVEVDGRQRAAQVVAERANHRCFAGNLPASPSFSAPGRSRRRIRPGGTGSMVRVVIGGVAAVVGRHLAGYEVRSVVRLGGGLDNVVYLVNGELVVRGSREVDPAGTRREAELLGVVAGFSSLPVPELVFVDVEAGVLAYRKLPGVPLLGHPVAEPARLAAPLGEFVGRLHQAPLAEMERLVPRDHHPPPAWLEEAERDYRDVVGHVPAAARPLVEAFLGSPPPPEPTALAFCHNDLGSEHVLVDVQTTTVTGVIDWTDAAIADPAYDLALLRRDLGLEFLDLMLAHYGEPWDDADSERARFYARCALLEDLAYGVRTGARLYAEAALAHLDPTFA